MNRKQTPAPAFAILALMLLAGCHEEEQPQAAISVDMPPPAAPAEAGGAVGGHRETAPTGKDGERIAMPELPAGIQLIGCTELLEHTTEESPKDGKQWRWKYQCRSREPFDRTVTAMNASGYVHNVDQAGGRPDYLIANHHYVGEHNGRTWDVDLKAFGKVGELKVTYLVTRAGNW